MWVFLRMLLSFAPLQQRSQDWISCMNVWKLLVFVPDQPGPASIDNHAYCCWRKKVIALMAVLKVWFVNWALGAVPWLQIQHRCDRNAAELGYIGVGVREHKSSIRTQALLARATALGETLQRASAVQNTHEPWFPALVVEWKFSRLYGISVKGSRLLLPKALWNNMPKSFIKHDSNMQCL